MTDDYIEGLLADAASIIRTDLYPLRCRTVIANLSAAISSLADEVVRLNEYARDLEAEMRARAEAAEATPARRHKFWGAGEEDCPRELKASNGELHTLRCKVCGLDDPREEFCRGDAPKVETCGDAQ